MESVKYLDVRRDFSEKLLSNRDTLISTIKSYQKLEGNIQNLLEQMKSLEGVVNTIKVTSEFDKADDFFKGCFKFKHTTDINQIIIFSNLMASILTFIENKNDFQFQSFYKIKLVF